jgi:hypothetical protein
MSAAELEEMLADAPFRFKATRVALEMEGHLNSDPWALGDALAEDIPQPALVSAGSPVNTGLHATLEEARKEMEDAGALTVAKKTATLREARATAIAWPPELRRPEIATFQAHKRFRDSKMTAEERALKLERLNRTLRRRVSEDDVRLWRESQKRAAGMPAPLSHAELLERRLRNSLRNWASPQTFGQLTEENRQVAVSTLRQLATEIDRGEFR